MQIYIPNHFKCESIEEVIAFIKKYPFATLISHDGFISKIPLLLKHSGEHLILEGHLAKNNPHIAFMKQNSKITVLFDGPHHYISPQWYSEPSKQVPTWNYQTVLMNGDVRVIEDQQWLENNVMTLADFLEVDSQWKSSVDQSLIKRLTTAISGIEIVVTDWQAKMKMSQNRSAEDRERVMNKLKNLLE